VFNFAILGEQNNEAYEISLFPHFFKVVKTRLKYKELTDKVQRVQQRGFKRFRL